MVSPRRLGDHLMHRDPTSASARRGSSREGGGTLSVTAVLGAVAEGAASTPTPAGHPASEGCRCPATGRPSSLAQTSSPSEVTQAKLPLHPSGREEVNRRFPWHLTTVLGQRIEPEPQRGPGLRGERGLGFSVSLGLKRPLFRTQTRTHQSGHVVGEARPPRAQPEERKQPRRKFGSLNLYF